MLDDTLFSPDVTVHCFWGWCDHTVTGPPMWAHDAMERHYKDQHTKDLDAVVGAPVERSRHVGDVVELAIGTQAMRRYLIVAVDDHKFWIEPIRHSRARR